jgi:hypothetical protein
MIAALAVLVAVAVAWALRPTGLRTDHADTAKATRSGVIPLTLPPAASSPTADIMGKSRAPDG